MVEHSLHTRGVRSSNLLAGTSIADEGFSYQACTTKEEKTEYETLLKDGMAAATTVIGGLFIEYAVVVVKNQVLALIANDVRDAPEVPIVLGNY